MASAAAVAELVEGVGGGSTSGARGEELYDFVRRERPDRCLELGFAHGVGSLYVAAALEANGSGHLTSVDLPSALERRPPAQELIAQAGLGHRIESVIEEAGYNWFLHGMLRKQRRGGAIEPVYDFVFIDGAHTWEIDGLALDLSKRLLRPGGWILLDDLAWMFDASYEEHMTAEERQFAHVQEIWDLLVTTDPVYDELTTDGAWGWARRSVEPVAPVRTIVQRDLARQAKDAARLARRKLADRTRRAR